MHPRLIYSWSRGLEAAAKILAKLLASPRGAWEWNQETWRIHDATCVCMRTRVGAPLGFPRLQNVEVAENAQAGFIQCQGASIVRAMTRFQCVWDGPRLCLCPSMITHGVDNKL